MNCYFCTFADSIYAPSLRRIKRQAKEFHFFKKLFIYNEYKLTRDERQLVQQVIDSNNKRRGYKDITCRGYGYWTWKPRIIYRTLQKLRDNDILLYCDAGCELNAKGIDKLLHYIHLAEEHDFFVTQYFDPSFSDCNWTKADLLSLFKDSVSLEKPKEGQIQSGTIIVKNNAFTRQIIEKWCDLQTYSNLHLFDDTPSVLPNYPGFKENRHDQSILSLLLKSTHYTSESVDKFYGWSNAGWQKIETTEPILQKRNNVKKQQLLPRIERKLRKETKHILSYILRKTQ